VIDGIEKVTDQTYLAHLLPVPVGDCAGVWWLLRSSRTLILLLIHGDKAYKEDSKKARPL